MASPSQTAQLSSYLEELRRIDGALATEENAEDLLSADREFKSLIDTKLGPSYDHEKIERVAQLQHDLQLLRTVLGVGLISQEIKSDKFFEEINRKIKITFAQCEEILGRNDFERLFDATTQEVSTLIDPNIFFPPKHIA